MQAQVEELGDNKIRLTVEVSAHDLEHAVEHAASDLAAAAKIPGFRKGKVPMPVLLQRVGKDRLYAEAVESHISGWFWNAAAEARLRPIDQPEYAYELPESDDGPWRFAATVAVQPEQALPDLQTTAADLSPVDDRGAQPGDVLVIDLELKDDARRDYVVELGSGRLAQQLETALAGATVGDKRSVPIPVSEEETSIVHATVKEISEKVLPPADDELERKIDGAVRAAAVDTLVEAAKVEAGGPLVEARTRELLNGLARSVERRGVSLEQYLSLSGRTPEQLVSTLRAEAAQSVARELVLEAVADEADITISDEEVDALVREQTEDASDEELTATLQELRENGGYERLREDLRLRAALDKLASEVKRIPVEVARARESIWTPEKEKPETAAKLWTPGSKEPV